MMMSELDVATSKTVSEPFNEMAIKDFNFLPSVEINKVDNIESLWN